MTELSHNKIVPLWGFILIIAVGSIIIIGGVYLAMRYYIRNQDSDVDSIRNDPETVRRVTVRRGRIVPHSHYMSLTGSQFGIGADDSRSGARSKSPFEWWTHSRSNSQMSQMKRPPSLISHPPEPNDTPRKHAPSPLRSAASFESEKPPAYTLPTKPSLAHRPPRTTNFSRPAFTSRSGLLSPSIHSALPQIIETSPHQSMISSRQSKQSVLSEKALSSVALSELEPPQSPASLTGFGKTKSHDDLSSTISSDPPFDHHPAVVTGQRNRTRIPRPLPSTHPSRTKSLPRSPRPVNDGFEPLAKEPVQTERKFSEVNSQDSPKTLTCKPSSYRIPGDIDHIVGQLSSASVQALPQLSTVRDNNQTYWESRQDLQPVRKPSKKGRVLRKKSLQRAERTSMVG